MKKQTGFHGSAGGSGRIRAGRRSAMRFLPAAVALLAAFHSALSAGTIRGKVTAKEGKDALPGANVFVRGTSLGAATDLNGAFVISNVPEGEQTLVVSFIGYTTLSVPVNVPADGTVQKDFALQSVAIEGKPVEVSAQALGQMQGINLQLSSDKIASMVGEARIQELPDFNAAQAISRLPGVSTLESSGEANKVVIRGLAPQFNLVTVEGVKLTSTGSTQMGVSALGNTAGNLSNDRSVDLTMVSPYMIKSISVFKSLTPDMDANSIGGSVNMELREAPSELHYDLLWQSGYTDKTENYGNFRTVGSVSRRFFDEKLGVYFLGNIEKYDRDDDNMSANYKTDSKNVDPVTGYRPVSVTQVPLNRHLETRHRMGGNLIFDYKLPTGSIKSVNMATRLKSDFQDNRTVLNYFDKQLNFTYREGVNTTDLTMNSIEWKNDFRLFHFDLKASHASSRNNLPESPFVEYKTGQVTTGPVTSNTIPDSLKKLWAYPGPEQVYLDNINLFSSLYKEENTAFYSNLKFPFTMGPSLSGYVKFGGVYRLQKNSNDQRTPYASIRSSGEFQTAMVNDLAQQFGVTVDPATAKFAGSNFMGGSDLTRPFLDDQFGRIFWASNPRIPVAMARYLSDSPQWAGRATGGADQTGGWYNGMFQKLANTYRYDEDYFGTYLMSELNFSKFMLVGGARYEKTDSKYKAFNMYDMRNPDSQNCDTVVAHPNSEFWLPMVQAKFAPLAWFDVRYAYTQTLARPDYHQMSPKITYDNPRKNIRAGNPNLKPAHAYNHDLILTTHSNRLGLFTVGGFYKTIEDFTYYTTYILHKTAVSKDIKTINDFNIMGSKPEDGATLYTYINSPYAAHVKGFEVDFQTRLWYLPYKLDGLLFGINYTKIESEARYPLRDERTDYTTRPPVTMTFDSTREGRLLYQPNDLLNAYAGYEIRGFSARVSFLFQGNSVSYVGAFPEQDGYTRDYFRIDASVRQTLPFLGMEVYLDVNNLNNRKNESAQRSIDGFTNVKHYGLTGNLGIRIRQ